MFPLSLSQKNIKFEQRTFHGPCINFWLKNITQEGPYTVFFK